MTSMPASRKARAIIFAPRSCPSSPGFAMTTRIFRATAVELTARRLKAALGAVPALDRAVLAPVVQEHEDRQDDDQREQRPRHDVQPVVALAELHRLLA